LGQIKEEKHMEENYEGRHYLR